MPSSSSSSTISISLNIASLHHAEPTQADAVRANVNDAISGTKKSPDPSRKRALSCLMPIKESPALPKPLTQERLREEPLREELVRQELLRQEPRRDELLTQESPKQEPPTQGPANKKPRLEPEQISLILQNPEATNEEITDVLIAGLPKGSRHNTAETTRLAMRQMDEQGIPFAKFLRSLRVMPKFIELESKIAVDAPKYSAALHNYLTSFVKDFSYINVTRNPGLEESQKGIANSEGRVALARLVQLHTFGEICNHRLKAETFKTLKPRQGVFKDQPELQALIPATKK